MMQPEVHPSSLALTDASGYSGKGRPIFIMGVMPRSGTNFLHRLICRHPDCGAINTTPVREDYVLHHAGLLGRYIQRLRWQWGHWGADEEFMAPLCKEMGQGVSGFLSALTESPRMVTKTPSIQNLSHFYRYFPGAHLIVIVRDGRSVVASGMSGFGWNFETASHQWAKSARAIIDFKETAREGVDRFHLVKYESLNEDLNSELERILTFLELDASQYDFDEAGNMPVFGSSYLKDSGEKVTWKPQEKSETFSSEERWSSWEKSKHIRFNHIAGSELEALGYQPIKYQVSTIDQARHRCLDGVFNARQKLRRIHQAFRIGRRAFRQELKEPYFSKVDLKR